MNGIPDLNKPLFDKAVKYVLGLGNIPLNPHVINKGLDHTKQKSLCMKNDIKELIECDGILLLPGWEKSTGAKLEKSIAEYLGLKIEEFMEPKGFGFGFKLISEFNRENPDLTVFVQGGAAAYLHIKKNLNVEIEIKNIDVIINGKDKDNREIYERFHEFLRKNVLEPVYMIKHTPEKKYPCEIEKFEISNEFGQSVIIEIFINQDLSYRSTQHINNISVEDLPTTILSVNKSCKDLSEDVAYLAKLEGSDMEELIYLTDKLNRCKERQKLLNQI